MGRFRRQIRNWFLSAYGRQKKEGEINGDAEVLYLAIEWMWITFSYNTQRISSLGRGSRKLSFEYFKFDLFLGYLDNIQKYSGGKISSS